MPTTSEAMPETVRWVRRVAALPVHLYRVTFARALGGQCRYTPTCSRYALEAIQIHGALKGWYLALRRLLRCHPFHAGGYDPVPAKADPPTLAGHLKPEGS